jgi:hypothetical protein
MVSNLVVEIAIGLSRQEQCPLNTFPQLAPEHRTLPAG